MLSWKCSWFTEILDSLVVCFYELRTFVQMSKAVRSISEISVRQATYRDLFDGIGSPGKFVCALVKVFLIYWIFWPKSQAQTLAAEFFINKNYTYVKYHFFYYFAGTTGRVWDDARRIQRETWGHHLLAWRRRQRWRELKWLHRQSNVEMLIPWPIRIQQLGLSTNKSRNTPPPIKCREMNLLTKQISGAISQPIKCRDADSLTNQNPIFGSINQ